MVHIANREPSRLAHPVLRSPPATSTQQALNCSCFIPVWSGDHCSTYKGVKYIDGGFTNNQPVFDEHTIRVACFAGDSDIAPYDRARMDLLGRARINGLVVSLTWKNMRRGGRALWPPPASYIAHLIERGFHDTKEFILSNDLIQCDRCFRATRRGELQPLYSRTITPTISPAASPAVSRASSMLNLAGNGDRVRVFHETTHSKDSSTIANNHRQWLSRGVAPIRLKEHRRLSLADAKTDSKRAKTGRLIEREALDRLRLEAEREQQRARRPSPTLGRSGFASVLCEKLQNVVNRRSSSANAAVSAEQDHKIKMPTIVVQEPSEPKADQQAADTDAATATITMTSPEAELADETSRRLGPVFSKQQRGDSLSSSASDDSAVSLGAPSPGADMGGSPAEKFLASRKRRTESISLTTTSLLGDQQLQDRFSSAPSPLPSCPPSPNLNRHCTECIRLRQQARLDGVDETIKRVVATFGGKKSDEPASEFSSIGWRLASWFRFFGGPKYTYSFKDDAVQEATDESRADSDSSNSDAAADDDKDPLEEAAAAERRDSHRLAGAPLSELKASY
jgi:hypothetical protein